MSEYDSPGLTAAAPEFSGTADVAGRAAVALRRLRTDRAQANARLPVDLSGLDQRLQRWADEIGRTAQFLTRVATEVSDADRRTALELGAGSLGLAPGRAPRADPPAGVGLGPGDRGPAVAALQRRLANAGHDPGAADGVFGPRTEAALRAYQRASGLEVTGRTDLATATALLNEPDRPRPTSPQGANGRLGDAELTAVGDGERMFMPAAQAFREMDAAARAAGHDLHVNTGYRTYEEQAALYAAYRNGTGNLAAAPGRSTHGLGLSADINVTDAATLRWLRANAGRYGFVNDVPSEAWHWTWRR
jgi:peptidoglycan hydrolase-like protein with peptidoglycan-binding domain